MNWLIKNKINWKAHRSKRANLHRMEDQGLKSSTSPGRGQKGNAAQATRMRQGSNQLEKCHNLKTDQSESRIKFKACKHYMTVINGANDSVLKCTLRVSKHLVHIHCHEEYIKNNQVLNSELPKVQRNRKVQKESSLFMVSVDHFTIAQSIS